MSTLPTGSPNAPYPRIVSLISSATEITCALGMRPHLVGRSHECDFPIDINQLPSCTEPKFRADGTSYEIDQRVRALVQEGLSVYRVFGEKIRSLRPDVILTQIQCEVCAVSQKDLVEATQTWLGGSGARIVSSNPNSLEDIRDDSRRIAKALGVKGRGEALIEEMDLELDAIRKRTLAEYAPRVLIIEWMNPLMSAGNWMPELVEIAGSEPLLCQKGAHAAKSSMISWESVLAENPDAIIVSPCGWDIQTTQRAISELTALKGWKSLHAVREGQVFIADGNSWFNRPGPRIVETAAILAEILHPHLVRPRYEGRGWIRYR